MKIKLFFNPEYSATSLWNIYGENLPYKQLPLSLELIEQLEKFDESIFEIINDISVSKKSEIYENGLRLFKLVLLELGDKYEIIELLDWIKP